MITALALLLGATIASAECDNLASRGTHISIDSHSSDERTVFTYLKSNGDRCESATVVGKLTYTATEDDVASMPFGASALFRERTGAWDRALSLSAGADGRIIRAYQLNGHPAEFDAEARAWLADFLPRVLMRAGVNVAPRVARWREQGGVTNVLRHIEEIESSGAMRAHYEVLLDDGKLTDDDLDRTLRSVSAHMRGSSGDLRRLLSRLAPATGMSRQTLSALEEALVAMPSSGDKAAVLELYGANPNREVLRTVMRAAATIASSGDRGRLLRSLVARYLGGDDRDLRDAWFAVADDVPSSGDLRSVLQSAMPYAENVEVARSIIRVARVISSSGDRSSVLISLSRTTALRDRDTRDAFMSAAGEIPSDGDKARVLRSVLDVRGL